MYDSFAKGIASLCTKGHVHSNKQAFHS